MAVGVLPPGYKRPRHKADRSPSSVEVKNGWSYAFTCLCACGVCRDSLTFAFITILGYLTLEDPRDRQVVPKRQLGITTNRCIVAQKRAILRSVQFVNTCACVYVCMYVCVYVEWQC